jgi:TatD DNase family protein
MVQFVDIHAHIQFPAFRDDADDVIRRAIASGVKMIAPSSQLTTAKRGVSYAEKYPNIIWAAVGLHPWYARTDTFRMEEWQPLAAHPRVVAIGETGLDYVDRLNVTEEDRAIQESLYRQHIELALSVGKPVIQHCRSGLVNGQERDAHEDALRIIAEYVPRGLRGVAHCFSGNASQAHRYLDMGFFLAFTGIITFNHSWDEIIRTTPLNRLFVETDIPYMTPVPHRGERNEPAYVRYIAERIAEIKGVPLEEVARETRANAEALFGIH